MYLFVCEVSLRDRSYNRLRHRAFHGEAVPGDEKLYAKIPQLFVMNLFFITERRTLDMRDFSVDLVWTKVQIAITAIGGWVGYFVGGMDGMLIALIVLMSLDYISGVMCAIVDRKLSSAIGFRGICKKVLILMLVGVANIVDLHVVGTGSALRGAVICFYMSNEALSLFENAAHIGLPIPDKLREALAQLHGRKDEDDTTNTGDGD